MKQKKFSENLARKFLDNYLWECYHPEILYKNFERFLFTKKTDEDWKRPRNRLSYLLNLWLSRLPTCQLITPQWQVVRRG